MNEKEPTTISRGLVVKAEKWLDEDDLYYMVRDIRSIGPEDMNEV